MGRGTRIQSRSPLYLTAAGDLYIGGTQVNATAAQLNALVANPIDGVASGIKMAYGYAVSITGSLEIASGLTTVTSVVAMLQDETNVGSTDTRFVTGYKKGSLGSLEIATYKEDGSTLGDAAVTVNWVATGT